jgi:hypothetical protein
MIRISSIGLSFISFVGNPCRAAAGSFPLGPMEPAVEGRVKESVSYTSGRKHRLTMRDSTMSIYTYRSLDPYCGSHSKG